MTEQTASFKPTLGLFDSTMIVAGSMIGSGIFIVSADIARNVGSAGWLIAVWVITGLMTLMAALSYSELSAMFPKAGGQYVYLKEAFNPLAGFLYGWSFFAVIQTATIAAVGVAFSKFAAYIIPALSENNILFSIGSFNVSAAQIVAILMITLLTFINSKGIKNGTIIQTVFTTTKILSLFGLIVFGFVLAFNSEIWNANWADAFSMKAWKADSTSWTEVIGTGMVGAIAAAMVGSIFSSDAWNNVTFIAGEVKNPKRNIGLALFLGTLIVTLIYVATNLMYVSVLPIDGIAFAENDRIGVVASQQIFGDSGTIVIAVMIMISTFGCNNGLILAGARVYNAMAIDKLFFKKAALLNKHAVPEYALWAQCIMASILCLSGKYGDLLDMIAFVVVLFYAVTIIGIFKLRRTMPDAERPYKAFGYPLMPAVYIIMALTFCVFLLLFKPFYTGIGLGIVLSGIPIYYLAISNQKKEIKHG